MKNILLLGDSIRKGYDAYVKERMADIANVYYPQDNCMYSQNILRHVHYWAEELELRKIDAIHWNAGHWDTLRIYGDEPLTDIRVYAENIERIIKRMKYLFPEAKIIFATSTPVMEAEFIEEFECRYNRDVEAYNKVACEVASRYNVPVNDLYSLLKDKPDALHSDQSHYYTADATELIGDRVAGMLCDMLGMDQDLLVPVDKKKFEILSIKNDKELYIKVGNIYERVKGI